MARRKIKSRGRQKINMVKMENESNLQVTFSKRRTGLFKKASKLCMLCAAQAAIIVFSPSQMVFSFGHPSVEAVIDRFLTRAPPPTGGTHQLVEAHRNATLKELNEQLAVTEDMIEADRKNGVAIDQTVWDRQKQRWWEGPLELLSLQQLEQLLSTMRTLMDNLEEKAHRIMKEAVVPFGNVSMGVSVTLGGGEIGSSISIVPFDHAGPSGSGGGVVPFGNVSMGAGVTLGCAAVGNEFTESTVPSDTISASGFGAGAGFSFNVGGNEFNDDVPCDRANEFDSGLLNDVARAGRYIGGVSFDAGTSGRRHGGVSFDAGTSGPRGGVSFHAGASDQSNDTGTSAPGGGVSFGSREQVHPMMAFH